MIFEASMDQNIASAILEDNAGFGENPADEGPSPTRLKMPCHLAEHSRDDLDTIKALLCELDQRQREVLDTVVRAQREIARTQDCFRSTHGVSASVWWQKLAAAAATISYAPASVGSLDGATDVRMSPWPHGDHNENARSSLIVSPKLKSLGNSKGD